MKTLTNQTLLYDEDCPLCQAYTGAFVKTGMLDNNGRKPYSELNDDELVFVDKTKAVDEIALIDRDNNTVTYGIDSLLKVIGNSFPLVSTIGNSKPIKFILKKLYSFISYNRKVIVPGKTSSTIECTPTYNYKYRIAYIVFAALITAFVLYNYADLIPVPKGSFGREVILACGQLLFQGIFLYKLDNKTVLNYLGNVMTVSLGGSILLLPLLLANSFTNMPLTVNLLWFGFTAALMFAEHYRRVKLLKLPGYLCITWVAYRIIALVIILNL